MPHAADAARSPRPIVVKAAPPETRIADLLPGDALPASGRTLRIALAMRGGVSLAVWIGGVAAELDLLRRIRLFDVGAETWAVVPTTRGADVSPAVEERIVVYAGLLDRAGYDRVEIDLLAGASAGGLNAVVYAVAQRAGVALDGLLRTWGSVGGFWGLLHEPGSWGLRAPLRGEGYFRRRVFSAIRDLHAAPDGHPDLVPEYVSVDLSATMIDTADQLEEDAAEGRGHFRFVGSDTHHLDNLVPRRAALGYEGKPADDRAQLWHLALAARSTSSLAGGFEPAEIASTEWASGEVRAESVAERDDLRFAFGAHRERAGEPFRVIDGAVFDNVPIDRALAAAKLRASDRLADRVLVFLDPEPDPAFGGPAPWDPDASRFFRAVGAMFTRSFRRESVAREAAELQRFNGQRALETGRRDSGAGLLAAASSESVEVDARRRAYVRASGAVVAERLADALGQPSLWQLRSASRRRRRYTPVDRSALAGLAAAAAARYARAADERLDAALRSPTALADAANCVLAWARELEHVPDSPGGRRGLSLPDVRRDAYAALIDAEGSLDTLTERVLELVRRTLAPHTDPAPSDLAAWVDRWVDDADEVDTGAHWRELDACVAGLALLSREVDSGIDAHAPAIAARWRRSPWRAIALAGAAKKAADLPPLANPVGIPAALSHVGYWTIGVDERPAHQERFTALLDDRFLTRLQTTLRTPGLSAEAVAGRLAAPDPDPMDRQTKLAGYGFGNFLGFLASQWRVNDWWWGRLDGSAGIVRMLATRVGDVASDGLVATVQDAVLAQSDEPRYRDGGVSPLDPRAPGGRADVSATDATRRAAAPDEPASTPHEPASTPHDPASTPHDPASAADPTDALEAERTPAPPPPHSADADADGDGDGDGDDRRARLRAGTDTLWNLDPGYRFALASRALRLIDRAAMPVNRVLRAVVQVVLAVLRPVLVALPAVADPPRLALVTGLAAGVAWLLTWSAFAPTAGSAVTAAVIVVVLLGVLVAGLVRSRRRWARVIDGLAGHSHHTAAVRARAASRWPLARYTVVAVASLMPLSIAVARANLVMAVLCFGVTLVLTAVAVRQASGARQTTVRPRLLRTNLMFGVFVLLGGLLPLAQVLWAEHPLVPSFARDALAPPLRWDLAVLTVGALFVAMALTVDWLPVRVGRTARRRTRGIDWLTVSALSTVLALTAAELTRFAMAGRPELHTAATAVVVFLFVWGNLVWWLPELRRRELPKADTVVRGH
jgi:patatin-related protein